MPDIPASGDGTVFLIVIGDLNAVQDPLSGRDLIRTHDHEHAFRSEDTILRQDIQDRMLGKERFGKVDQVGDHPVVGVRPERGKLKAVAGLFLFDFSGRCVLDGVIAGGVGVILGIRAVGDHKDLHILIQSAPCPETVPLIPVDLIERLTDRNAPALQLNMHEGKTVDKHRHVIAVIMLHSGILSYDVLIDHLHAVVMDVLLIDEGDVLCRTIVTMKDLHVILLDLAGLLCDAFIFVGNTVRKELFPLTVRENIVVELFQLPAQIEYQVLLAVDRKIFISLFCKQTDKLRLQSRLALIGIGTFGYRCILRNNCILVCFSNNVKIRHGQGLHIIWLF